MEQGLWTVFSNWCWSSVCSSVDLLPLLGQRSDHYTAIIIEEPHSYVGREVGQEPKQVHLDLNSRGYNCLSVCQVILDLLQFSGVQVKRALSSDRPLLEALRITAFPSIYLLHPNATHAPLHV